MVKCIPSPVLLAVNYPETASPCVCLIWLQDAKFMCSAVKSHQTGHYISCHPFALLARVQRGHSVDGLLALREWTKPILMMKATKVVSDKVKTKSEIMGKTLIFCLFWSKKKRKSQVTVFSAHCHYMPVQAFPFIHYQNAWTEGWGSANKPLPTLSLSLLASPTNLLPIGLDSRVLQMQFCSRNKDSAPEKYVGGSFGTMWKMAQAAARRSSKKYPFLSFCSWKTLQDLCHFHS